MTDAPRTVSICDSLGELRDIANELLFNPVLCFFKENANSHLYPEHCMKAKTAKNKQGHKEVGREENVRYFLR